MGHRTYRAIMRVLEKKTSLIHELWGAEPVDEGKDEGNQEENGAAAAVVGIDAEATLPEQVVPDVTSADLVSDTEANIAHDIDDNHDPNSASSNAQTPEPVVKTSTRSDSLDDEDEPAQDAPKASAAEAGSSSSLKVSGKSASKAAFKAAFKPAYKTPSKKPSSKSLKPSKSSKSLRGAGSKRDQTKLDGWLR